MHSIIPPIVIDAIHEQLSKQVGIVDRSVSILIIYTGYRVCFIFLNFFLFPYMILTLISVFIGFYQ